ncbi:MAG: DUF924 domain-containing protein [Xanthomonadales bacterium]
MVSAPRPWDPLLDTWFGDTLANPAAAGDRMGWWFGADERRDAELGARFGGLVEDCAAGRCNDWLEEPDGRLALIIALDQLPRNLFRGTARAFAYDPLTAALCMAAAMTGQDQRLAPLQRMFLYMPLQHFEDLAAQEVGVALYTQVADERPETGLFRDGFLKYARLHRDIIARFGRFPHRNAVLGRENTAEESDYLAGDAPRFGQ